MSRESDCARGIARYHVQFVRLHDEEILCDAKTGHWGFAVEARTKRDVCVLRAVAALLRWSRT